MARLQRPTTASKVVDKSDEIPAVIERGRVLNEQLDGNRVAVLKAMAKEGHGPGLCIFVAEDVFGMDYEDAKELVHSELLNPNTRKVVERLNNDLAHVAAMAKMAGEDGATK